MEKFRLATSRSVGRFLRGSIDFAEYVAVTDRCFSRAVSRLSNEDILQLRVLILGNNDIVMDEMLRRQSARSEERAP